MVGTMDEASKEIEKLKNENALLAEELVAKSSTKTTSKPSSVVETKKTKPTTVVTSPKTVPTPAPTKTTTTLTVALVGKHQTVDDCWIIVAGKVYAVSGYISIHPGGRTAIINQCGQDATTAFQTKGGIGKHSSNAYSVLNTFFVGAIGSSISL